MSFFVWDTSNQYKADSKKENPTFPKLLTAAWALQRIQVNHVLDWHDLKFKVSGIEYPWPNKQTWAEPILSTAKPAQLRIDKKFMSDLFNDVKTLMNKNLLEK